MFKKSRNASVLELITDQLQQIQNCMNSFDSFMQVASDSNHDHSTLRALCEEVYEKEHLADISLRRMIDSLGGTAFLPSTREELITIATRCDKIANKCEDISYMIVLQNFQFPENYYSDVRQIMYLTKKQFEILQQAIRQLFTNMGNLLNNQSLLDEIRDYESQIDVYERKLYEKSYRLDLELAMKKQLTEFISSLCDLSDIMENVADQIQIMLVTRKA